MQHNVQSMIGNPVRAIDGDLGKVHGFYFDNETWTMRYLVAETGNETPGRKTLVSLAALGTLARPPDTFSVNISCNQVQGSPEIDLDKPICRQHEIALHDHYGWPHYWTTPSPGTTEAMRYLLLRNPSLSKYSLLETACNSLVRSTRQLTGYHIPTANNEIGHVEDFIVDIENWALRFLVVDTGDWLPGRKVLIPPAWIKRVKWSEKTVLLHRSYESSETIPDFERRSTPVVYPQEISTRAR